jgi:hypothetical protein
MTTSTIEAETKLSGADLHTSRSSVPVDDLNHVDALCSPMKMYESGQIVEEEESEVDLMIQLSGMVHSDTRVAE